LDAEQFQLFYTRATGFVLSKNNKLALPSYKQNEDGTLKGLNYVSSQLKELKNHLTKYDMINVFGIVQPVDVANSIELETEVFRFFEDYPRLSIPLIANSNHWWSANIKSDWIKQNLEFSFEFLKANTSESLWGKARAEYDTFEPCRRGGPLMLYLILNRIQDCSEASIDLLKVRLKSMKISELPGEDIEVAVSFIKSCQAALIGASRPEKWHVPDDLSQTVLQIMQTTTVEAFNKVFRTRCEAVVWIADETHLPPEWPSVSRITNLATGTYLRMKADKTWTAPDATPKAGGAAFTAEGYVRPDPICFNCDGAHLLPNCEKPRDEDKIAAAKAKWTLAHPWRGGGGGRGGGRGRGRGGRGRGDRGGGRGRSWRGGRGRGDDSTSRQRVTKIENGQPMVLNKKGAFVLDSKAIQATKSVEHDTKLVTEALKLLSVPVPPVIDTNQTMSYHTAMTGPSGTEGAASGTARSHTAEQIRAAIARANQQFTT
jgi:hypothetical protein